jgi:hypothetical protein
MTARRSGKNQRFARRLARLERLECRLPLAADLVISEFMAANSATLADEDRDYPDWVEIHNPTPAAVDLAGWHLTDNLASLAKWTFPPTTLAAGGRLVVFASGKDRATAGASLHANFRLDGDGEFLALVRPDLTVASAYAPTYPDQVPDVSFGMGPNVTMSNALSAGAAASVLVPADGSLGTTWTAAGFDDSQWNDSLVRTTSKIVITEAGPGEPGFVEIQNVSDTDVDTSGWVVAVSAGVPGNPSAMNNTLWSLPASTAATAVLYRTDSPADNYWGSDIAWTPGGSGWVMIVDDEGIVVDFAAWGYTQTEIAGLTLTVGDHLIGGSIPITPVDYEYEGNSALSHPISPSYPDLTGTLLIDGNLGTTDWRSGYAGSQEPNSAGNSGRPQPRVTFDLGNLVNVRSVTITYMADQSAGIYAPDQVTVLLGSGGLGGSFAAAVVSTGFDDSPDGNPTTYFGAVRNLTVDLAGATANAVRLDFLNDREWTFLSEVSFMAASANVGWRGDGAASGATAGSSLSRHGTSDHNNETDFAWQAASPGAVNPGLVTPFPISPVVTGLGYEQEVGFEDAFATDVIAAMQGRNASVYLRVPFTVTQADSYAARLRIQYDSGFVAYLNGQEVARRNAPAAATWNSRGTLSRSDADSLVFETIDLPLTAPLPIGANVLAIHGLNDSPTSPNFLLVPELDVAQVSGGEMFVYFSTPTPGNDNSLGLPAIAPAPMFSQPSGVLAAGFSLTLSTTDPLAAIHYTLDGTEPTLAAARYTTPLAVNASALVKARAFRDGHIPSPIRQGSYLRIDPALSTRDSDVPLVVIDTLTNGIPGSGGAWASSVTALIETDATGRAHLTGVPDFLGRGGLHVRGSSSAAWPKKNYSFETWDTAGNDLDVSALGFPAESDWVLYASYLDRTLLRDSLVYELSNQYGQYGVRTRPVEVYLNADGGAITEADYAGVYVFMERIKRDGDRVDVADLEPSHAAEPEISGGYVLKIDRGAATIPAALSRDFVAVDPEDAELTPAQKTWITGYIAQFEAALSGSDFADPVNGYAKYIDVPSWIDYHIMTELTYNVDEWYLSTYLSKDRGGKLTLGPFWDFDRSLGNTSQIGGAGTTGWYSDALVSFFAAYNNQSPDQVVEYPWFRRLFADPNFYQKYVDRRQELRRTVLSEANIFATIDRLAAERLESQSRNFERWNTLNAVIAPSPHAFSTYEAHVANLKSWIAARLAWLDAQYVTAPEFMPLASVVALDTPVTMQVPGVPTFIDTTLIAENSTVKSLVPTDNSLGTAWTGGNEPFDDSAWTSGQNGVGYETATGYESYIHLPIPPGTLSSYIRHSFTAANPPQIDQLLLKLRYDDGFVAYVNGVEVARSNAPAALAYNLGATASHDDTAAAIYQDFDISAAALPVLRAGANVLAIHGLNYLTTSSDYLIQFELVAREEQPVAPQNIPIYYTTDGSDPRVPNALGNQQLLVTAGASARARVPTSDIGTSWRNIGFDDSSWQSGMTGVGFEKNPADSVNYTSLIETNVRAQIDPNLTGPNEYKGVYVRIPFSVANTASIGTLRLRMKYDDGFVAYLNGTRVASAKAPSPVVWNSQSTAPNPDTAAVNFELFDITAYKSALVSGPNVLAIHGLGAGLVDSDMLILPELESVEQLGGISPSAVLYNPASPPAITANTRISARAYDGTRWSGLTTATYTLAAPAVRIAELHYHPLDPSAAEIAAGFTDADDFEFVELINTGLTAANLDGIRFSQGIQFTFGNETLAPGERIVVAANRAAFEHRYGAGVRLAGEYGAAPDNFRFNNGGETVTLVGPLGEPMATFSYDDAWVVETDGQGKSLVVIDPANETPTLDEPAAWRASFEHHGSPGRADLLPGDANGDLRVDAVDLAIVQANLGTMLGATRGRGDLDGDGDIDRADVATLAANFGRSVASPSPSPSASPSAVVLPSVVGPSRSPTPENVRPLAARRIDAALAESTTPRTADQRESPRASTAVLRASRRRVEEILLDDQR